jgi:hypothetical protein
MDTTSATTAAGGADAVWEGALADINRMYVELGLTNEIVDQLLENSYSDTKHHHHHHQGDTIFANGLGYAVVQSGTTTTTYGDIARAPHIIETCKEGATHLLSDETDTLVKGDEARRLAWEHHPTLNNTGSSSDNSSSSIPFLSGGGRTATVIAGWHHYDGDTGRMFDRPYPTMPAPQRGTEEHRKPVCDEGCRNMIH